MERARRNELLLVAALASVASLAAFLWVYLHGELLFYGDAVAHINIARRVFDSRHPSPLQLGTVWLPLPHIAVMPFIVNDWMWRTGVGGSIPSMIAYVLGVVGIYRLVRARAPKWPAVLAASLYGLNPNLLYMQSTAMTETIFLATVIWSLVYLDEFTRALFTDAAACPSPQDKRHPERDSAQNARSAMADSSRRTSCLDPNAALRRLAYCISLSILTRYDGWFFGGIVGMIVLAYYFLRRAQSRITVRLRTLIDFLLLPTLCACLWLAINYAVSGDPLDFTRGPYSARAIAARTTASGAPPYPGERTPITAGIYFLKCAKLNVAHGWPEHLLLILAVLGTLLALRDWRNYGVWLLLWMPLPFYMLSIAYGSVPIFIPVWWPFSYYNVRYGMQLIPMFAVLVPFAAHRLVAKLKTGRQCALIAATILLLTTIPFRSAITVGEARVNARTRRMLEARLAQELRKFPPNSTILMSTSEYVGALQTAGIPIKNVIWEGIHTEWDESIAAPTRYADYIVTYDNDPVSWMVKAFPQNMELIADSQTPEKPRIRIYRSLSRHSQ